MKKFFINLFIGLLSIITALSFVGCSNSNNNDTLTIEQYVGKWYCYKTVNAGETVDFRDFPAFLDIELSIEFSTDKTYVCHYYVNGNEGEKYPQEGTFTVSDNSLLLSGDISGFTKISGTEMILTLDGVTQYFQRNNF